jgi:hypothetical protein
VVACKAVILLIQELASALLNVVVRAVTSGRILDQVYMSNRKSSVSETHRCQSESNVTKLGKQRLADVGFGGHEFEVKSL